MLARWLISEKMDSPETTRLIETNMTDTKLIAKGSVAVKWETSFRRKVLQVIVLRILVLTILDLSLRVSYSALRLYTPSAVYRFISMRAFSWDRTEKNYVRMIRGAEKLKVEW